MVPASWKASLNTSPLSGKLLPHTSSYFLSLSYSHFLHIPHSERHFRMSFLRCGHLQYGNVRKRAVTLNLFPSLLCLILFQLLIVQLSPLEHIAHENLIFRISGRPSKCQLSEGREGGREAHLTSPSHCSADPLECRDVVLYCIRKCPQRLIFSVLRPRVRKHVFMGWYFRR